MTANEEFLSTFPPDLVAEARLLQERVMHRDNYLLRRQPQVQRKKPLLEEDKIIAGIVNDERLSSGLVQVEDSLLEVLLKGLYLSVPINREIYSSLLLNLTAQQANRQKILDGLVSLLIHLDGSGDFPPHHLYGSDNFLENYNKVYAIVSVRIIDVLQYLFTSNPKVSMDLVNLARCRVPLIRGMRPEETQGFQDLISLMDQQLFRTSTSHLTPLVTLISLGESALLSLTPLTNRV